MRRSEGLVGDELFEDGQLVWDLTQDEADRIVQMAQLLATTPGYQHYADGTGNEAWRKLRDMRPIVRRSDAVIPYPGRNEEIRRSNG